ncbi:MAG: hypothetical protein NT037_12080 [Hyphomicrobiales bacterium]|nr:hypothetical protein [Hyphomicrobiales bacterium]
MSQPVSSPDAPPTASLGALPAQLGALLALCAALAGAALASQHLGSPLLATAAMLAQLCLLTGTLLLLPLLLDRTVRKPLATLARGMISLTPPHADDIIRLSGRADAVGEVARASILLLERHDHVEGIASSVRDAQGVARDLRKMADMIGEGQNQIAHYLLGATREIEALRRVASEGQTGLNETWAAASQQTRREVEALKALRRDLSASGSMVEDAARLLQREAHSLGAHRSLAGASLDATIRDLSSASRALATQVRTLGPDGHDIAGALVDIGDRRASFVQTIDQVTIAALRLEDLLRRVDQRVRTAHGEVGSTPSSVDAAALNADDAIPFEQLVGRALPAANHPEPVLQRGAA